MEDASERKLIQLEPFAHQVGGHSSMLCLDGATVAKPLVTREQRFYETLPASLRPFVPSFHGALEVHVIQGEGGYVTHAATPPPLYRPHVGLRTRRSRIRLHDSGDIEIEGESEGVVFEDEDEDREAKGDELTHLEEEEILKTIRTPRTSVGHALNPWVLRCHRESLSGITPGTIQTFILLENLTARFKQPCVLDLKVGTRQYGDSASPAKVRSKMMKVATTTSGKLGLRLGGMQVYQVTTRRFLCRNKLFGRALTVDGFRMALMQFLHNGWHIRLDVVRPLLERLEALEGIMTRLGAARFYTCSLLCLYEGELRTPSTTPLSPSTPAPPITPGPFSSMPPSSFSSASSNTRFIFPTQSSNNHSFFGLVSKSLGKSSRVRFNSESNSSSPHHHETFSKSLDNNASIALSSLESRDINQVGKLKLDKCTSNYSSVCSSNHLHSTCPCQNVHSCRFLEDPDEFSIPTDKNSCERSSADHNLGKSHIRGNDASTSSIFNDTPSASTSKYSSMKPLVSCQEKQYSTLSSSPDSVVQLLMHSSPSKQSSENVQELRLNQSPDQSTKEEEKDIAEKKQNSNEVSYHKHKKGIIGRSVSADSVCYVTVSASLKKTETKEVGKILETKVNGYFKEKDKMKIDRNGREVRVRRSHSFEPQIPLNSSVNSNFNQFAHDSAGPCYNSIPMPSSSHPLVDVRLIDFAHSTHRGLEDPVVYAGPDQGFLFGLHNLIKLLKDIAQEATTAMERI